MTLTRSFIRNAVMTPLDARLFNMAELVCNNDGSPRVGVLGPANASIVATTATMNVTVAAAEFATSKGKADGVPVFTNDGTVNVLIGAAPASNSRIDVIWVKHNDDTTGDANALPVFGVTAGVAAASPTKPAIPTGALELATLRIYSGTTATNGGANTLTNTYQMTASRGGTVAVRTAIERTAWTNPVVGQEVLQLDTLETWQWTGAAWGLVLRPLGAWTPTLTGFTLGNGTLLAEYTKRSRVVDFFIELAAGTTTAASGTMGFTLPEAGIFSDLKHIGRGLFTLTTPANSWPVEVRMTSATTFVVNMLDASVATLAVGSNVTNTAPTGTAWGTARPKLYLQGSYVTAA